MINVTGPAHRPILGNMMIFVDGTNLFHRLVEHKLIVPEFSWLFDELERIFRRTLTGVHLYTIQEHLDAAKLRHGNDCFDGIRVTLGDSIPQAGGTPKEKCVDALLVADMVYHAALKNVDYVMLISSDTDFRYAIKRVQDFGCRSALVAIGTEAPPRLRTQCDDYKFLTSDQVVGLCGGVRREPVAT